MDEIKEDDANEPRLVICMRQKDAPPGSTVIGATKGNCTRCGCSVWVAPTTRALIANNPDTTYNFGCMQCALILMEEEKQKNPDGEPKFERVPGQAEELARSLMQVAMARNN